MTLQDNLQSILSDKHAKIWFEDSLYCMSQLADRVSQLGEWLAQQELQQSPVAICLPNSPELLCWQMATFLTGATLLPIIYDEPDEFILKAVTLTQAKLLIISKERRQNIEDSQTEATKIVAVDVDHENLRIRSATNDASVTLGNVVRQVDSDQLGMVIFSSGTSGTMKGIMHSQASILAFVENLATVLSARKRMSYLVAQPMGHIGGIVTSLLTLLFSGTVILLRQFETNAYLKTLKAHKPTHINLHTPLFYDIVDIDNLDRDSFSNIECCFAAGDNLATELPQRFTDLTGAKMRTGYGMSEIGIVTVNMTPYGSHAGSVGYCVSGMSVQIRDKNKSLTQSGQVGEIWAKSPVQCLGYWQMAELNAETIDGQWFRTGDAGYANADGEYWYVGRLSTAIDLGGQTLFPSQIEKVLYALPFINKACATSAPRSDKSQLILYVEITREAQAKDAPAQEWVDMLGRLLHDELAIEPRRIDIRLLAKMPLNMTGKIDRAAIKDMAKHLV